MKQNPFRQQFYEEENTGVEMSDKRKLIPPVTINTTPNEVISEFLSYLSPEQLAQLSRTSKRWKMLSDHHPNWVKAVQKIVEEYKDKAKTIHEVKDLTPEKAKKIYPVYAKEAKIIDAINAEIAGTIKGKKIPIISSFFEKNATEIFKSALLSDNIQKVITLLSNEMVDVNHLFNGNIKNPTEDQKFYSNVRPIHIAAIKGNLQLIEVLLKYKANVTETLMEEHSSIALQPGNSAGGMSMGNAMAMSIHVSKKAEVRTSLDVAKDFQTRSLIYLSYAEYTIKKGDIASAKMCFKKSCDSDVEVAKKYVNKVIDEKVGLNITYNEKELNFLRNCFDEINSANKKDSTDIIYFKL